MARVLEEGDELALPWDELADGRVWQLVRGRDFFCSPREVDDAARNAAGRLGRAVQTLRTVHASVSSIWVQFADYRLEAGAPCPCGSDELRRVNDQFAICASCEASLLVAAKQKGSAGAAADGGHPGNDADAADRLRIFVPEGGRIGDERKRLAALRRGAPQNDEPRAKPKAAVERKEARAERKSRGRETRGTIRRQRQERREQQRLRREAEHDVRTRPKGRGRGTPPPRPQQDGGGTLDSFTNVRLWGARRPGRYWGYGYDGSGRFVLLEVTVQVSADGAPVEDPGQPGRALHLVSAVRAAPFSAAVDAEALLARPDGMSPDDVLGLGPR